MTGPTLQEPAAALDRSVAVSALGDRDCEAWDEFVRSADGASFFHLSGWKSILERTLGHRAHYLIARRGGQVTGILPLAEIRSRLFGHSLISTPFCVYGGVVAASESDAVALETHAIELAEQLQVEYLELRNLEQRPGSWAGKDLYVTFRKAIAADDDTNLRAVPRKQRAMIRKGIKAGLESDVGKDPGTDLGTFYRLYSESVRNLGTPVLGRSFYGALLETFRDDVDILTVTTNGTPVSSVMSFYFRDEVLPYYGGGAAQARDLKANDFMYWELMRHAAARGVTVFDFGRSKLGTGSMRFKKHWGFEPQPLFYQYHLVRAQSVPDLSPMNPRYQLMIGAWRRLPLWVTQIVGPPIARSLG